MAMIREATIDDFDFLFALCRDMCSMAGYDKGGLTVDADSSRMYLHDMIIKPDCAIFIAEKEGKPIASIGLITFFWEHNRSQKIAMEEWWYVHPDHRGNLNLVTALIELAEWWANRQGAISLWVASTNNRKVDAFYRRHKFHPEHRIHIKEITNGA
jgi:GNAT superfamily N-acetyltransferase